MCLPLYSQHLIRNGVHWIFIVEMHSVLRYEHKVKVILLHSSWKHAFISSDTTLVFTFYLKILCNRKNIKRILLPPANPAPWIACRCVLLITLWNISHLHSPPRFHCTELVKDLLSSFLMFPKASQLVFFKPGIFPFQFYCQSHFSKIMK